MNKTKIDWTDWTWNPVTGCLHGCSYCYARAMARRWGKSPAEKTFEPMFHPQRLSQVKQAKPGDKVFVCSMADLFGEWVPDEWIEEVMRAVRSRPDVEFQFLTKNPERYDLLGYKPKNFWMGATATNQFQWDWAMDAFKGAYNFCFISCEPLLEEINPGGLVLDLEAAQVGWLIIGGCTGPKAKQPEERWVKRLEDWADENMVPVFHKDNLQCRPIKRKEFPF